MVRFLMWYILLIDFGHVGQSQHGTETSHAGDINSALVCATTHVDSLFLTLEIRWEWLYDTIGGRSGVGLTALSALRDTVVQILFFKIRRNSLRTRNNAYWPDPRIRTRDLSICGHIRQPLDRRGSQSGVWYFIVESVMINIFYNFCMVSRLILLAILCMS